MLVKTKAIVLSALRYQDKNLIVRCFTESSGLKSYFVRNAFTSARSSQKAAYFQPLSLLEIEAMHKNKGTLEQLKEVRLSTPYVSMHTNLVKGTIALFLSEMLQHAIREEEHNPEFFAFLEAALLWLDHHDQCANFHLVLLLQTSRFLGFYPDTSRMGAYFEMTEGVFSDFHAVSSLSAHETQLLVKLLDLPFDEAQKAFHVSERQQLLKILIDYYGYHLPGFRKPKSLEVLKELFS